MFLPDLFRVSTFKFLIYKLRCKLKIIKAKPINCLINLFFIKSNEAQLWIVNNIIFVRSFWCNNTIKILHIFKHAKIESTKKSCKLYCFQTLKYANRILFMHQYNSYLCKTHFCLTNLVKSFYKILSVGPPIMVAFFMCVQIIKHVQYCPHIYVYCIIINYKSLDLKSSKKTLFFLQR